MGNKLSILFVLLFASAVCHAVPTPISSACIGSVATGGGTTSSFDSTGATLLIITVADYQQHSTLDAVSDSKGNSWHSLTNQYETANIGGTIWYAYDHGGSALSAGASHTATVTGNYSGFCFSAWSGTLTTGNPLDQQNGNNNGTGTGTLTTNSITPSVNGCLIITSVHTNNTTPYTINSSYTVLNTWAFVAGAGIGNATGYLVQTTAAATNPTWTTNSSVFDLTTAIASFKPGAGASPVVPRKVII